MGLYSPILKEYWNEMLLVLENNKNSVLFKTKLIRFIKNSVINENDVLSFLNNNIENMSSTELKNIEVSLNYLNKFRNR